MTVSVFDLFSIGIGPVQLAHRRADAGRGPIRALAWPTRACSTRTTRVRAELFGSLGATGHGHGSYNAVLWGLEGEDPETVDTGAARTGPPRSGEPAGCGWPATHQIAFDADEDLILHRRRRCPSTPTG